jgi:lysophospholipase L1-like esterase
MVERAVINKGCCGDTTQDGLSRIQSDVLSLEPYLVIVEFGANDYFQNIPKDTVLKNLRDITSKIQDTGAMVALCDVSGGRSFLKKHDIYHAALKQLAQDTQAIFIPFMMKGVIQRPRLLSDSFHPNAEGYRVIAKKIYNAIEPYL